MIPECIFCEKLIECKLPKKDKGCIEFMERKDVRENRVEQEKSKKDSNDN